MQHENSLAVSESIRDVITEAYSTGVRRTRDVQGNSHVTPSSQQRLFQTLPFIHCLSYVCSILLLLV